jgi:2-aminobenzoate-CoA ligase
MSRATLGGGAVTAHVDTFVLDRLPAPADLPEFRFDRPEFQFPERLNCGAEILDRAVAEHGWGDRLAVLGPDGLRWRYRDLAAAANRIAHVLVRDLGLVPGNRVLLHGVNSPLLAAAWFAVMKAGGVAVTTMPLLRDRELRHVLATARVTHVLCDAALRPALESALDAAAADGLDPGLRARTRWLHDPGPAGLAAAMAAHPDEFAAVDTRATDPCLIAFTSGTTGKPKGTVHFHRDVLAICNAFPRSVLRARPDDVFVGSPPLAFTFGLGALLLFPLVAGAATALLGQLRPAELAAAIEEHRATVCFTAPTGYRAMAAEAAADLGSLRVCVSAGEALPTATRQLWQRRTGLHLVDGLGATELLHIVISMPGERAAAHPGALGRALPGYQVAVLDDADQPLPPGAVGRLAVRGPTGCRYLDDPRQREYVRAGWNVTGDSGWLDEDGYFHYRARTDDLIVSSGYNISPTEVEDVLLEHPAVRECAVVGVPDQAGGTVVAAFVVPTAGRAADEALAAELKAHVKATAAPYKYPKIVQFRAALPRTESGKLQRFALRAEFETKAVDNAVS